MKIAHLADIHFRPFTRHAEYRKVFEQFFRECKKQKVDVIAIIGDIYHCKTQGLTPETIAIMTWFFRRCGDIAPTHVLLGNHDLNLQNVSRMDAITPILEALDHPNIFFYKKSGTYPIAAHPGFNFCAYSCADEHLKRAWKKVKPIEGEVNIAMYHGSVRGAETDDGWKLDADVETGFFKGYDFALLGDIHKQQFLRKDKRIAYCGSTVPQNFGESNDKGFLVWDIRSKNDFDVEFVHIVPPHPYVTIDWQGDLESTLEEAKKHPSGARFRIRSTVPIPQVEIKHLHKELKEKKKAKDIVYKIDHVIDANVISAEGLELFKEDLTDHEVHMKLLGEYFKDDEFSDDDWELIEKRCERIVNQAAAAETVRRNTRWSVKKIEFDNAYCFGKDNCVDFSKMNGITGIFGHNKSGKSSFIGTMVYGLFNTTDRGSMKNLHVINDQTGYCKTKIDLAIDGSDFVVERQSVRHENKKRKEEWASTALNFARVDDTGETIEDLNGTQRVDTDARLRERIGTVEDLMLTSIAAQRGPIKMDKFLTEGPTARRAILSRFMGLDIFIRMLELLKDEAKSVEVQIEKMPDCDWERAIDDLTMKCADAQDEIDACAKQLRKKRRLKTNVNRKLEKLDADGLILPIDVKLLEERIAKHEAELDEAKLSMAKQESLSTKTNSVTGAVEAALSKIPIAALRAKLERHRELKRSFVGIEHELEKAQNKLKNQEKSIKKLALVPCGDEYPTCRFIRDSHDDKKLIDSQRDTVTSLMASVKVTRDSLKEYDADEIVKQIEEHRELEKKLRNLKAKGSEHSVEVARLRGLLKTLWQKLKQMSKDLERMRSQVVDVDVDQHMTELKQKQQELEHEIQDLEGTKLEHAESKGRMDAETERLVAEQEMYAELRTEWRVYEKMLVAWSKKGIPAQIIASQLPVINAEITRILHGISDFTLELEAGIESNAMDIYIDDDTSRRIFELSSGMECLMGMIAIRVALINISSLPKTDMLIIDEGFGALDEMSVEAAGRLLHSLKRWFRNIILITHVDTMKDVVDNVIEITKNDQKRSVMVYP